MDILAYLDSFTPKQRLTVLSALGAMVISLNVYSPQGAVAPNLTEKQEDIVAVQGTLPKGYSPNAVIRDPFAIPAQYAPQPAAPAVSSVGRDRMPEKAKAPLPVVQGIISAGSAKAAILAVGSDSRTYRVHEQVGSYVITSISNHSVTLQGPDGSIVLALGR